MRFAFICTVDKFLDAELAETSRFLGNSNQIAAALQALGIPEPNILSLTNETATYAFAKSRLRAMVERLQSGDQLHFFLSTTLIEQVGKTYVGFFDSVVDDLPNSAMEMRELLGLFEDRPGVQFVLHFGVGVPTDFHESVVIDLFDSLISDGANIAVIWTALIGRTPLVATDVSSNMWCNGISEVIEDTLTSPRASQEFLLLNDYVQRLQMQFEKVALRHGKNSVLSVTSVAAGQLDSFVVFEATTAELGTAVPPSSSVSLAGSNIFFRGERTSLFSSLHGFQSHHRVPDNASPRSQAFAQKLAERELIAELESLHRQLREIFKFKRQEIQIFGPVDGLATLTTTKFQFSIAVHLDEESPNTLVWTSELSQVDDQRLLAKKEFSDVFGDYFNSVRIIPQTPLSLANIVDRIEDTGDPRVRLEYDMELTRCAIRVKNSKAVIEVTPTEIGCVFTQNQTPKKLTRALQDLQRLFGDTLDFESKAITGLS